MYGDRLHAWWSTQSWLATLLSSSFVLQRIGPQTISRIQLKYLSINKSFRARYCVCCWAHWSLTVGFLFRRYAVFFTVESLSLFYLLFVSPAKHGRHIWIMSPSALSSSTVSHFLFPIDDFWHDASIPFKLNRRVKVSKGAKIRNRYNQVPHLTQDTNEKVTNSQKTPQTRAKRSALSQQVTTKHI